MNQWINLTFNRAGIDRNKIPQRMNVSCDIQMEQYRSYPSIPISSIDNNVTPNVYTRKWKCRRKQKKSSSSPLTIICRDARLMGKPWKMVPIHLLLPYLHQNPFPLTQMTNSFTPPGTNPIFTSLFLCLSHTIIFVRWESVWIANMINMIRVAAIIRILS